MSTNNTTDPILLSPNDPTMAPPVAAAEIGMTATNTTPLTSEHNNNGDNDNEDASEVAVETKGERGKFLPRVKGLLSKENEEVRASCCSTLAAALEIRLSLYPLTS